MSKTLAERISEYHNCCDNLLKDLTDLVMLEPQLRAYCASTDDSEADLFAAKTILFSVSVLAKKIASKGWRALYALSAYDGKPIPSKNTNFYFKKNEKKK